MKRVLMIAAAVTTLMLGSAAAQAPAHGVDQFFRRELGVSMLGMFAARPEVSGQGFWQNGDRQLVINWSNFNTEKVVAATMGRVGAFCANQGGTWSKEVESAARPDSAEGVHACRRNNDHLFDIVVSSNNPSTEPFGAPKHTYYVEPVNGEAAVARTRWAERNASIRAAAAQAGADAADANARTATLRANLAAGTEAVWGSGRVLVIEVRGPLAFVQPSGSPAVWVKIDELKAP